MKKQFILAVVAMACLAPKITKAQGGFPGNNSITGGFLGWAVGPAVPLQIRNNFNQPINLFTNNIWRASITTNNGLTNTNLANYNFNVAPQTGDGI